MTINGRAFVGNTPVFRARVGETVQWDVLALGDEFHTFHVHGHRWRTPDGAVRDTQDGRPGRELHDPLARGRPGDVALPLPRREPHDERDDRHLPGDTVIRRGALIVGCALAVIGGTAAAADAPTRDVAIPGKAYDPARITVLAGTTVTWRNGDSLNHTVSADNDAFDSGYLAPGGSFSYTFAKQGHYAYNCLIHKFMKGSVDVFSLVLTGPERPVLAGKQVVVAGLAPAGTATVTLTKLGGGEPARTVKARPDGSFTVLFRATTPGAYRATVGKATSPVVRISVVPRLTVTHTTNTRQRDR